MGNQSMRPTVASVVEREIQLLWIKRNKFANWVYGESENRSQYGILRKKDKFGNREGLNENVRNGKVIGTLYTKV